ncbi:polysaccharide deacetylase family protein [Parasphingorhabdus pacifica]
MTQTVGKRAIADAGDAFPYVLMYHSISTYTEDPYSVTVDPVRFESQLAWLRALGLRGVSMCELLRARERGGARGLVGMTFDDGYADFAENAVPTLVRYGWTATVFVLSGRLGANNAWDADGPRKALMTAEQVEQVAASGMEIGSHGVLHQSLVDLAEPELSKEISHSHRDLREISGQPVQGFCYPYGHVDPRVAGAVLDEGYEYGMAIWRGPAQGRFALPRTYVGDRDGAIRLVAKRLRHERNSRRRR